MPDTGTWVAIYAAVVSTGTLAWRVSEVRYERGERLRLGDQTAKDDGDVTVFHIRIFNEGARNARINKVLIRWNGVDLDPPDEQKHRLPDVQAGVEQSIPLRIEPGSSRRINVWVRRALLKDVWAVQIRVRTARDRWLESEPLMTRGAQPPAA
jgi:hypothetical protein